jgi:hypothetical protein
MKKLARLMAFVMAAVLPMQSFAAFECNAKVQRLIVYATGDVNLWHSARGDYTVVCNLNGTHKGVSSTTCAMWTAMLQSAKKRDVMLNFYYGDATGSCATLPLYGEAPVPSYLGEIQ